LSIEFDILMWVNRSVKAVVNLVAEDLSLFYVEFKSNSFTPLCIYPTSFINVFRTSFKKNKKIKNIFFEFFMILKWRVSWRQMTATDVSWRQLFQNDASADVIWWPLTSAYVSLRMSGYKLRSSTVLITSLLRKNNWMKNKQEKNIISGKPTLL
jgi:hypothetical protein